ncbi:hypothetical protein MUK42_26383 [Musa troglodytarum]|uniref:RRM domain-containing protein n=1 Tax=Musa troglodytarum TaxID=320322 RepID=A0A9E7HCG7_9LILI|nr:hypothetical protein MUK42_26383 [Musa troglodytarum]
MGQQFGDTTLTKVFVGGLAWETQKEALREHFQRYGEILEAVIISDKITGRSKGYGFVTFKEAEAAKKACEDATPMINGRRANCNLASLGAKRSGLRPSPPSTPAPLPSRAHHPPPGMVVASRGSSPAAQWYYPPTSGTPPPPSPFQLQHYHGVVPFYATAAYGYSPNYVTDVGYNAVISTSFCSSTNLHLQAEPQWRRRRRRRILPGAVLLPSTRWDGCSSWNAAGVPTVSPPESAGHGSARPLLPSRRCCHWCCNDNHSHHRLQAHRHASASQRQLS